MPDIIPEYIGAPVAIDIPMQSGSAIKKTTIEDDISFKKFVFMQNFLMVSFFPRKEFLNNEIYN